MVLRRSERRWARRRTLRPPGRMPSVAMPRAVHSCMTCQMVRMLDLIRASGVLDGERTSGAEAPSPVALFGTAEAVPLTKLLPVPSLLFVSLLLVASPLLLVLFDTADG